MICRATALLAVFRAMTIKIIRNRIPCSELKHLAQETFVEMIKAVADVQRGVIAVGGELHADAEDVLINDGSEQQDLWGFNIYFDGPPDEVLEFTSLINIRPRDNNPSLKIQRPAVREKIEVLVKQLIDWER
jgi:hypothetical protein